ncbi:DUF2169 domain-containing protein [Pyxidicoccus sp. 3LG]
MLHLTNTTPFSAGLDVFANEQGVDTLYMVVKATFQLGQALTVAEEQVPIHGSDVYWGEPGKSSIRYPGDRHLTKPSTDVLLVGHAHSPRGKAVEELAVGLSVGPLSKVVRVVGDRFWRGGPLFSRVTSPAPFISMPLVYERAFGGAHEPPRGKATFEAGNPVGRGFKGSRGNSEMDGMPLPNLEDPRRPVAEVGDRSTPACFAPIAPSWAPRREHAGTYDESWHQHRAPYLPEDFDSRFFNVAPQGLIAPTHLAGGEPVKVVNASLEGPLQFSLPICRLGIEAWIADDMVEPRPHLETVLIEPDQKRLCMSWRAAVSCDKRVLKVQQIVVRVRALELTR